jgi:hypothetical protein
MSCQNLTLHASGAWRRPGQANRQNQDARIGANTPNRDAGKQQGVSGVSGNVWGGAGGKGKVAGGGGAPGGGGAAQPTPVGQAERQGDANANGNGFNAAEMKEYLKKSEFLLVFPGRRYLGSRRTLKQDES